MTTCQQHPINLIELFVNGRMPCATVSINLMPACGYQHAPNHPSQGPWKSILIQLMAVWRPVASYDTRARAQVIIVRLKELRVEITGYAMLGERACTAADKGDCV